MIFFFQKPGKSSVIRVGGTRWMAHTTNALENLFNRIGAHRAAYSTILEEQNYRPAQWAKVKFFLNLLNDSKIMSFALYNLDICRALAIFSKI